LKGNTSSRNALVPDCLPYYMGVTIPCKGYTR